MSEEPRPEAVEAWARLFRAHKLLLERVERDLKRADLPPLSWYDVLYEVYSVPEQRLRQFELAERVLLSKYNLSRLLDRLAAEKLITRHACPEDKRGTVVALTSSGRALLKRMWKVYGRAIQDRFEARLSQAEVTSLTRILRRLIED